MFLFIFIFLFLGVISCRLGSCRWPSTASGTRSSLRPRPTPRATFASAATAPGILARTTGLA
jgi:hypothetical protein